MPQPPKQGGRQAETWGQCVLHKAAYAEVKCGPRSWSVAKAERALVSSQNPYWSVVSGVRHDDSGDKFFMSLIPFRSLLYE